MTRNLRRPTTMLQLAKRISVSRATISKVINNQPGVKERTRQRILDAIAEHGYRPHPGARSLVMRKTGFVGIMQRYLAGGFNAEVIEAMADEIGAHDYGLILSTHGTEDIAYWKTQLDMLIQKRVDGILARVRLYADKEATQRLKASRIPVVYFGLEDIPETAIYVRVDDFAIGHLATSYLLDLGHRRILCLMGAPRRTEGYFLALSDRGIEPVSDLVVYSGYGQEHGYRTMLAVLKKRPRLRFTAMFACDDFCALGAMKAMSEKGIRVPDDISVIGSDDVAIAAMITPALTTVAQPKGEEGRLAACKLLDLIRGKSVVSTVLPPKLIVRNSCAPCRP